jgi:monoterpene epsilon-lactone hydrolase
MSLALTVTSGLIRIIRALPPREDRGPAPIPKSLLDLCELTTEQVDGCTVHTLTPKAGTTGAGTSTGTEVIYTHGGAYVHPISSLHWVAIRSMIERTGATFTVPLYGLGPDHKMAEAYAMLDKVYESVTARAGTTHAVFLMGDSAGGGLALGQAIRYRDAGVRAPDGAILFSPWVELTMTNPAIANYERVDPMLHAKSLVVSAHKWTDDLADPLASQLHDSLAGLPPLSIYLGGHEILYPDVEALAAKAEAAGTKVHLYVEPKGYHVWFATGWVPESRKVLDDVAVRLTAS